MNCSILSDITSCSPSKINRRFGGTYRRWQIKLCLPPAFTLVPCPALRHWTWRRYVPPKRQLTLNGPHGVISPQDNTLQNRDRFLIRVTSQNSMLAFLEICTPRCYNILDIFTQSHSTHETQHLTYSTPQHSPCSYCECWLEGLLDHWTYGKTERAFLSSRKR
jgi:hypothetical protein